jgi:hypothetical protein
MKSLPFTHQKSLNFNHFKMITLQSIPLVAGLLATSLLTSVVSAQNVGIGTTTPKSKLSVNGSTASGGLAIGDATYTSTTGTVAPANGAIIQGNTGIATTAPICQLDVRGTTKVMATTGTQTGEFWSGTANVDGFEVITYPASGDAVTVGIQRAGQFPPLHLSKPAGAANGDSFTSYIVGGLLRGSVTATAGGIAFNTTSDERLKENIRPSAKGLGEVMKIQVSDYNYKTSPDRPETGFIAQQLNTVFPNAVTPGGEDPTKQPWTVDYGRVTPVLTKAIQEQQQLIEELKKENALQADALAESAKQTASLQAEMKRLAASMEAIQALVRVQAAEKGGRQTVSTR